MANAADILNEFKKKKSGAGSILQGFNDYYNNYKKNTQRVQTNDALNNYNSANNNYNNKVNQGYKPSNNVNNALNNSNQWADKMGGMGEFKYENKYDDKIAGLLEKYENNKFSYDINSDPLYQQLADNYQQKGKQAMVDTMGQASAMTGGYGSSYASSVGQQAYQQNLNELNSVAPQLAEMAYGQYSDKQNQTLQLSQFYSDLDSGDYNKAIGTYQSNMDRYKGMMDYYKDQYQYMDNAERNDYQTALDAAYKQMNQAYGVYEGALGQDNYENTMQNNIANSKADQANKEYDYARQLAEQMANQANADREHKLATDKVERDKYEYGLNAFLKTSELEKENATNSAGTGANASASASASGYTSDEILALGYGPINQSFLETLISKGEVQVDKNGNLKRVNKGTATSNNPFLFPKK